MGTISIINDNACLRGAIKSILSDYIMPQEKKDEILKIVERKTTENITYIEPIQFIELFSPYFTKICFSKLNNIGEINKIHLDEPVFALLFWQGNQENQNRHVTRFLE